LSAVSINDNMELIGDFATNIAKNVMEMNIRPGLIEKTKMKMLGDTIILISSKLMDSFVNMNNDIAIEVIKIDYESEKSFKENFEELTGFMKIDNQLIESCSYLIDINSSMHFISRQIRSVAQELVFLFEAKMIKHQEINDSDSSIL
jgi:phosphate transport system protein